MNKLQNKDSLLGCYRVLDLTDNGAMLCGKLLADMGANVLKIEKPCGDDARTTGPFWKGIPSSEKSLYWLAFNANKKGITLDIETEQGQEILRKLVRNSDILIESYQPGYMDRIGIGYNSLSKINPQLIMTSITPFGQTGPYKDYKWSDITLMALGGLQHLSGDPDRAPVRISVPQSGVAASTYATEGTMVALYGRSEIGRGQHVDVSAMQTITWLAAEGMLFWLTDKISINRQGRDYERMHLTTPIIWQCKDGHINYLLQAGLPGAERNINMAKWLEDEGLSNSYIKNKDWHQWDWATTSQEELAQLTEPLSQLFLLYTKRELFEDGLKRGISIYTVNTSKDIAEDIQLEARKFWVDLECKGVNDVIKHPGAFSAFSETPLSIRHGAPTIGEHNEEIYIGELGFRKDELATLKESKVI